MPKEYGNTQDLVAIENIENNTVILKDGGLRQIVMVSGINFALKSETEQNIITQAYQNFLNSLDFPIQIIIHSRKVNIEEYIKNLEHYETKEVVPLLQNQAAEYKEFIRGFVEKNAIMEKTFLVVVPFAAVSILSKQSVSKFLPFWGKKNKEVEEKAKEEAGANLKSNIEQLGQRVSQVSDGLNTIGLEAATLNNEQLVQLFYNFYNPETIEKEQIEVPK